MKSVNKIILVGNVGRDPEKRDTSTGKPMCKFSLATQRGWGSEETDWHNITAFGKLAEVVLQWVKKGDRLYIEGSVQHSKSVDADGNTRYWTEVVAREMVMLGAKAESGSQGSSSRATSPVRPLDEPEDDLPF